jgi:REP element-mobilizing transposase RayT
MRRRWTIQPPPPTPAGAPSTSKPILYHCISRVVDRRFAFGPDEKEKLRTHMRMYETFSGNRILSYCFMSNHIHLLLEVTPHPPDCLTDDQLLTRLRSIHSEAKVALVAKELADARKDIANGIVKNPTAHLAAIHGRFTRRMHDLSQFMQAFLQRYTQWHNSKHKRTGHLWEARFKSVIVEDGFASRTIAAYIDLNPVRAGIVSDPAQYRWSSYGEAIGGGPKGNGKKAREGLVRACLAHQGATFDSSRWKEASTIYRRLMGLALEKNGGNTPAKKPAKPKPQLNTAEILEADENGTILPDLDLAAMLRHRLRYFTDGAVIGSKAFVNEAFANARERFGPNRKDGARKLKGNGKPASGTLWSLRDLKRP